jgi:hypothetical protein
LKKPMKSVEAWLKKNRTLDPSEAEMVASAIEEYCAPLIARAEALQRVNSSLENARERNLRQIGLLTIALQRHGLMEEARQAIRDGLEEGNTDG